MGRGRARRRIGVLVKDVLFDRLQFGDLACHLLQAGRELIDAMRCLLLTGGNTVADAKCPFRNFLNRLNQLGFKGGGLIRGGVADVDA